MLNFPRQKWMLHQNDVNLVVSEAKNSMSNELTWNMLIWTCTAQFAQTFTFLISKLATLRWCQTRRLAQNFCILCILLWVVRWCIVLKTKQKEKRELNKIWNKSAEKKVEQRHMSKRTWSQDSSSSSLFCWIGIWRGRAGGRSSFATGSEPLLVFTEYT